MPQNNMKQDVEVTTPIASSFLTVIDTPIAKDMKRDDKSGATKFNRPFVVLGSDLIGVGICQRDLIPTCHCRNHLADSARETKPK